MKQNHTISNVNKAMLFLATVAILFLVSSCGVTKSSFQASAVVPAAEGGVKIKKDANDNYAISIDVVNLAEPGKLNPAKSAYVVWIQTKENGIKNIGQIITSSGFLSGKLKAGFETVTPFNPVKVYITTENDASIQYPSGVTVLTTGTI